MKLLKEIVAQWGNVNAEQCKDLACYFPDTPLIIKWGYLPREEVKASEVPHTNRICREGSRRLLQRSFYTI